MNWLARLKKIETPPRPDPTEPTKPGFVGFVGTPTGPIQKTGADASAANDPAADPDRWCWPHSEAMNTAEIDTFTARLHHFTGRGLAEPDAEGLAGKLVARDRESDDRRLCVECSHLAGHATDSWSCSNWQASGVVIQSRSTAVPMALTFQLQRCTGFNKEEL